MRKVLGLKGLKGNCVLYEADTVQLLVEKVEVCLVLILSKKPI